MTPYEHWEVYTKRLHAPRNYLKLAFYFMVGAALQRRVWLGGGGQAVFPNQFLLLVADPGIGKGIATGATRQLIESCRIDTTPEHPDGKPLFPVGFDSGSFEKIVSSLVDATKVHYYQPDPNSPAKLPYTHSSSIFYMDEITSMIHKESKLITPFLLTTWDCKPFNRGTHKHGAEIIKNPCPSIVANTQPDTFQDLLAAKVMGTGLLARFLISYAPENAFKQFLIPDITAAAKDSMAALQDFLKALSGLFGPLSIEPSTLEWLNSWWAAQVPLNKSPFLKEFYGRKNIHIIKLAIAIHFSRTFANYILSREDFEEAIRIIEEEEPSMHLAFSAAGLNKYAGVAKRITQMMYTYKRNFSRDEILLEVFNDIDGNNLDLVLKDLVAQKKIKSFFEAGELKYGL